MVQKYKNSGTLVAVHGRSGRPRKLTVRSARYVTRLVNQNQRKCAADILLTLYLKLLVLAFQLQPDSMHTTAHQANLHGRRPCRKHLLKPKHKQARLQFANNHEDKPLSFWDPFLWSDETKVNLFGSDGVQNVWRRPGDKYRKKMSCTHSQTWWRQSDGLGLHKCTWCRRASLYRWYHECRHVLQNIKCEDDTIS